jgi:hypothetical protein
MTNAIDFPPRRVVVILDAEYGEKLRGLAPALPIWIVMSPTNEPVIRSLWSMAVGPIDPITGITGLRWDPGSEPEERFLYELDTIDLHHGPDSTMYPYTVLEVIGVPLTVPVRTALSKFGFYHFTEDPDRFIATRSLEEANRISD